jgi:cell fate (sporulation/competence/biofilm development) regulator YlbF (YheA/YmcA/DUF963 family)
MKLKVTGLKKEMSTTGTGASFTPGVGAQYASPKAFKKRKDEIGEPFTTPNPSVPNRKSKFIDYKQLFEDAVKELYSPIKDMTSSQANIGDNSGYDMDTQDAASVLEREVGDTETGRGIKTTVSDINPETGAISWDVEYVPAFDSVYKEFDDLRKVIAVLDQKTDDKVVDDIAAKIKAEFNRYRTHIRKNYPEAYKRFTINEARYSQFKRESQFRTPTQQLHSAVREIRRKIDEMSKVVAFTERMRTELKASNEGMSYLNRTREAISKINEKLQELNNRIKGLTE